MKNLSDFKFDFSEFYIKKLEKKGIQVDKNLIIVNPFYLMKINKATTLSYDIFPILQKRLKHLCIEKNEKQDIIADVGYEDIFSNENKRKTYVLTLNQYKWTFNLLEKELRDNYKVKHFSAPKIIGTIFHEESHIVNGEIISIMDGLLGSFRFDWNNDYTAKCLLSFCGINKRDYSSISIYADNNDGDAFAEIISCMMYAEIYGEKYLKRFSPELVVKMKKLYDLVKNIVNNNCLPKDFLNYVLSYNI